MDAELRTYERSMGLFIEGVGPDQLLFRYTIKGGDNSRSTHEASFVLDLSTPPTFKGRLCRLQPLHLRNEVYLTVLTSTPQLLTMPVLVDQLNETGDVYAFIKRVRQAYVKLFS
jgi:kinetochore protein Spc25